MPCSVFLEGEYNAKNICLGVPVVLGKNGVEKIIELKLSEKEKQDFANAVKHTKELTAMLK